MVGSRPEAVVVRSATLAWLAVAAWMAVIFWLSTEGFAAPETEGFFAPLLRWLFPGLGDEALAALHFGIRKSAHAGEYALLALLTYRALGIGGVATRARQLGFALSVCVAVAIADETRQAFLPARGGTPADVAVDVAGALAALALAHRLRGKALVARWLPAAPGPEET